MMILAILPTAESMQKKKNHNVRGEIKNTKQNFSGH